MKLLRTKTFFEIKVLQWVEWKCSVFNFHLYTLRYCLCGGKTQQWIHWTLHCTVHPDTSVCHMRPSAFTDGETELVELVQGHTRVHLIIWKIKTETCTSHDISLMARAVTTLLTGKTRVPHYLAPSNKHLFSNFHPCIYNNQSLKP